VGKNIVVLCDGTNNAWKPGPNKTNVVKLSECLHLDESTQIRYYDPGVGTAEGYLSEATGIGIKDRLRRIKGLAWADGVWENVSDAYRFLMNAYEHDKGDRIFLFGFSRGAFTARAVAGLINLCGLLRPRHENMLPSLIEVYRSGTDTRKQRDARTKAGGEFRKNFAIDPDAPPTIHFLGIWDTVESVGVGQLIFDTRITSDPSVKPAYRHVRHAVALDELRWPYTPRLFTGRVGPDAADPDKSYKQVWFCGAHCDVGGSYAEAGLSNESLQWMAREANACGLLLDSSVLGKKEYLGDPYDLQHDEPSAAPAWSMGWTFPRDYGDIVVHESVKLRAGRNGYHPALDWSPVPRDDSHAPANHDRKRGLETPWHTLLTEVPAARVCGTEPTRKTVWNWNGDESTIDVRLPAKGDEKPQKRGISAWRGNWLVLAVALAGTVALLVTGGREASELAWLQLTQGWNASLRSALVEWKPPSGRSVERLLELDFYLILFYFLLMPYVIYFALRWQRPSGHLSRPVAVALGWCGGWLVVFDLLENVLTIWTLERDDACTTMICVLSRYVVPVLTSAASCAKTALLIGFLLAVAVAIAGGCAAHLRPATRQPPMQPV
jgi:hypothetical protein